MATRFRLREVLEEVGLTQTEAANLAGLGLATVNRMCRFPGRSQTLEILDRLSAILHVEPGDLITRAPIPGQGLRRRGPGRPPLAHPRAPAGPRRVGSRARRGTRREREDPALLQERSQDRTEDRPSA